MRKASRLSPLNNVQAVAKSHAGSPIPSCPPDEVLKILDPANLTWDGWIFRGQPNSSYQLNRLNNIQKNIGKDKTIYQKGVL
jgi:hypothetical protein